MNKRFARIFATLILAFALLWCAGCGRNADNDSSAGTYNSRADYSGVQGYKGWYYLTARDSLAESEYMIWDSNMCTWRMNDVNCLIEPNIVHPGQLDQAVRAWRAPADGTVEFKSVIQRRPFNRNGVGQDGVYAFIATSDDNVLDELLITATDLEFYDMDGSVKLKAGESIYFVLNCNGNYTFDQTYWDITINFTL